MNTGSLYKLIVQFLGSRRFTYAIVLFFVFESVWLAFSFAFPMVFDENWHFGIVQAFSDKWWPIIYNQPESLDHLRNLGGGSTLYHFILSFPYRFISQIIDSSTVIVVSLRLISISFVVAGLLIFIRLFREMNISTAIINVSLLFFTLLPITAFVAAHINYDNLLFLLMAIFLLIGVRIIKQKKFNWSDYTLFVLVGSGASLVKFSFLPVFFIAFIFLGYVAYERYGVRGFFAQYIKSIKKSSYVKVVSIFLPMLLVVSVFASIYVVNVFSYGNPIPRCAQQLSERRCLADPVIKFYTDKIATKDERTADQPSYYILHWLSVMTNSPASTAANITTTGALRVRPPLQGVLFMTFMAAMIGIGILIYAWRAMPKQKAFYFVLVVALFYVSALFYKNIKGYYDSNFAGAIQPRYLILILPVLMVYITYALNFALGRFKNVKLLIFGFVFSAYVLCGAGISTHILRGDETWWWQNQYSIKANAIAKDVLSLFVIDNR